MCVTTNVCKRPQSYKIGLMKKFKCYGICMIRGEINKYQVIKIKIEK